MAGLKDIMGQRLGVNAAPRPRGGGGADPARYSGADVPHGRQFLARGGAAHSAGELQRRGYFADGGEVEEESEAEHEVTPDLKLAAYELLECLDNHAYADDKGGRAEALAKHLLAFFHLAEEMPHEEGPHVEEDGDGEDGGYEDGE